MGYRDIPEDRVLKFDATPGFKGWEPFFTPESTTHPAKMCLSLLRWILETYTSPGDVVLDPMAGTGSTVILAALKGRHGIAVEYEPRFCEMIRANIELTERQATLTPKGRMLCIQGDARELSKLLGESDAIITSPPYSESLSVESDEEGEMKRLQEKLRKGELEGRESIRLAKKGEFNPHTTIKLDRRYSSDPQNIGNLPHGDIDAVITSPPFGPSTRGGGIFREGYRAPGEEEVSDPGLPQRHGRPLSDDPRNIDNLEYGDVDTVITSPPYSLTREGSDRIATGIDVKTGKSLWSKTGSEFSEGNIQKLPHGDVDAVITSPPYEGSVPAYDEKWLEEHWDDESDSPKHKTMRFGRSMRGYPKKVDSVVTSPPYGNRLADDVVDDGDEARISYRQAIDSIVTSPPYEGSSLSGGDLEKRRKRLEEKYGDLDERRRALQRAEKDAHYTSDTGCLTQEHYSSDSDNIGNLKSESYLSAMLQCYREMWKVLKRSGKLVVVVKNFIREKAVVRLDLDTIKLCEAAGFRLADRWYFKLPLKSFWRILYSKRFPHVPEVEYEDVLVFEKKVK